MRFFTALILLTCFYDLANAQRFCATPLYAEKNASAQNSDAILMARPGRDTLARETIIIPVVVHVVYKNSNENISDAQVLSQIEVLNRDFGRLNTDTVNTPSVFRLSAADCGIRFRLAMVDPQGRKTSGIVRKQTGKNYFISDDAVKYAASGGSDAWDATKYLNIWVCNMGNMELGYSSVPGSELTKDGVVISFNTFGSKGSLRAGFSKGRTATHEIGHWLGLRHIWGDKYCGDDGIDDTPPQKSYNQGCPSYPKTSECSRNSHGDMFMNFMDYANDDCMNIFTNGQCAKMRSQFASGGLRNGMLDPTAFDTAGAAAAPPVPDPGMSVTVTPKTGFSVGPNPVQGKTTLRAEQGSVLAGRNFELLDCQGRRILGFTALSDVHSIDLSKLKPGTYFLRNSSAKDFKPIRIIKLP
jgi:hypothetical protein